MTTPDANGWIAGMESAPKDEMILVCVPSSTEDGETDYIHSLAWWVEEADVESERSRWDGEWRYIDMPGAGDLDPTHWKPLNLPVEYAVSEAA